jgi:hypothetical protein
MQMITSFKRTFNIGSCYVVIVELSQYSKIMTNIRNTTSFFILPLFLGPILHSDGEEWSRNFWMTVVAVTSSSNSNHWLFLVTSYAYKLRKGGIHKRSFWKWEQWHEREWALLTTGKIFCLSCRMMNECSYCIVQSWLSNFQLSNMLCQNTPFYQQSTQHGAEWITLPHHAPSRVHILSRFTVQARAWPCHKETEEGSKANTHY